ncbi:glycosyltransferase [Desulfosporosinus sp. FKA]|uniref:glycosyltransferase n=1 Tax=Desulfosporosinus sp. FKA TaxID=1969834 RepID=UPI000B49C54F|nr:glycosyltransferase [Desulfosporosinus sp. FKA]
MIKVVQFIHGMNMGGAETLVKEYALRIDKTKFSVNVLCFDHQNSPYEKILKDAGVEVTYICERIPSVLQFLSNRFRIVNKVFRYFYVRKYIHEQDPDVIHAHLVVNSYIKFARPKKGTHIFFTQHYQVKRWREAFSKDIQSLKWIIGHYPTKIIALNEEMRQEINLLLNINNTIVLNNGIDLEKFQTEIDKSEKRKNLNIPEKAFVVGHVGRFAPVKNHKFLVQVFSEIKKVQDDAFLLMIGKGDTEDSIRKQLAELKMLDSMLILNDRTDVAELLKIMDVVVFPSITEGLGISIIEMQASGIPCVASDGVPRATEISNKICYMSLQDSAEYWAQTSLEIAHNEERVEYTDDLNNWNIKVMIAKLEAMYKDVADGKE